MDSVTFKNVEQYHFLRSALNMLKKGLERLMREK